MNHELTPAERSLLRATQLLWDAGQAEIEIDLESNLPELMLQDAVRAMVWQAAALLPDGVPLDLATGRTNPDTLELLAALEHAEAELRTLPIWDYPVGVTRLIADICDAIARTRAAAWA